MSKKLAAKALRCEDVYEKHDINEIFIKEIEKSIQQSMRWYCVSSQSPSLQNLAFHVSSFLKFKSGQRALSNGRVGVRSQDQ